MGDAAANNNISDYSTAIFRTGESIIATTQTTQVLRIRYTDGTYDYFGNNEIKKLTKDIAFIYVHVASQDGQMNITIFPMIRESNITNNTYEPYNTITTDIYLDEPILAHPIYEVSDYIDFENQSLCKLIGRYVFDETTNFTRSSSDQSEYICYYYTIRNNHQYLNIDYPTTLYSGYDTFYLTPISNWYDAEIEGWYINYSGSTFFYVTSNDVAIRDFKTMLTNTPVALTGVLKNSENIKVNLPTITTINGTNILTFDTQIQPSKVNIKGKIRKL